LLSIATEPETSETVLVILQTDEQLLTQIKRLYSITDRACCVCGIICETLSKD